MISCLLVLLPVLMESRPLLLACCPSGWLIAALVEHRTEAQLSEAQTKEIPVCHQTIISLRQAGLLRWVSTHQACIEREREGSCRMGTSGRSDDIGVIGETEEDRKGVSTGEKVRTFWVRRRNRNDHAWFSISSFPWFQIVQVLFVTRSLKVLG